MPEDDWQDTYKSLSKDIESLRKELLTERIKNLPEMVKGMVKTAREDVEVRVKELQQSVTEERRLVDEKIAEVDTRVKELDSMITSIQENEKRVMKFIDTYEGEMAKVRQNTQAVNDDLKRFQGKIEESLSKVGELESAQTIIRGIVDIKRDWGKISTKWEKFEKRSDEILKDFKSIKDEHKLMESHINGIDSLFKNIIKRFEKTEERMVKAEKVLEIKDKLLEGADSLNALKSRIDNAQATINAGQATINEFRQHISQMSELYQYIGQIGGKMSELEVYYKEPDKWLGEKVKKYLGPLETQLSEIDASIKNESESLMLDWHQTILIAKLTEIVNSESWENIVSNLKVLEFLVSEMRRKELWTRTFSDNIISSLASTRDFWETRKPEVSAAIQQTIDFIERGK